MSELEFAKTFWRVKNDILGRVITGDETWVYQYDPDTTEDCQFPTTKNFRQSKSRVKTILLTFLILDGLFILNLYQLDKQSAKYNI
jgi:hypothetical protein